MTVTIETSHVRFEGSGTTGPFPYTFYIASADELEVIHADSAGTETTLVNDTDFTITGLGVEGGGNVTLTEALAVGEVLVVRRNPAFTQATSYTSGGRFTAASHEDVIDTVVRQIQGLFEKLQRTPKLRKSVDSTYRNQFFPLPSEGPCLLGYGNDGMITSYEVGTSTPDYNVDQLIFLTDVTAETINAAQASLSTSGGRIVIPPGTYTISEGTVVISNSNITLELLDGAVLNNAVGTDFLIKVTGDDCRIVGPGTIQVPDSPAIGASSLTSLRTATIWNTADRLTIQGVVFQNSISYTIFNEGGDDLRILNNWAYGEYDDYTTAAGTNHFFYYQDGGSRLLAQGNFISGYAQGFGSGTYGQPAGTRMMIVNNQFSGIGNHPVYIASGGNYSIVNHNIQEACGGSFALTGTGIQANFNIIDLDSSSFGAQGGLAFRNSVSCEAIGNLFTGVSSRTILSADNTGSGTSITGVKFIGNTISMSSGTCYNAILVGTTGTTTVLKEVEIIGNRISGVDIDVLLPYNGLIQAIGTAAGQVTGLVIRDNLVNIQGAGSGIHVKWATGARITGNVVRNTTTLGAATVMYLYRINETTHSEISNNLAETTTSTNLTLYDFMEYGTNVQTCYNRFLNNRLKSAMFTGSLHPMQTIAGNSSIVEGYVTNDTMDTATDEYFRITDGNVLFLTSAPGGRPLYPYPDEVFPKGYEIDLYNIDSTGGNTVVFDFGHLGCTVAAGKHGVFRYTGSAWVGSQID